MSAVKPSAALFPKPGSPSYKPVGLDQATFGLSNGVEDSTQLSPSCEPNAKKEAPTQVAAAMQASKQTSKLSTSRYSELDILGNCVLYFCSWVQVGRSWHWLVLDAGCPSSTFRTAAGLPNAWISVVATLPQELDAVSFDVGMSMTKIVSFGKCLQYSFASGSHDWYRTSSTDVATRSTWTPLIFLHDRSQYALPLRQSASSAFAIVPHSNTPSSVRILICVPTTLESYRAPGKQCLPTRTFEM